MSGLENVAQEEGSAQAEGSAGQEGSDKAILEIASKTGGTPCALGNSPPQHRRCLLSCMKRLLGGQGSPFLAAQRGFPLNQMLVLCSFQSLPDPHQQPSASFYQLS